MPIFEVEFVKTVRLRFDAEDAQEAGAMADSVAQQDNLGEDEAWDVGEVVPVGE